jgi:two-component sensor histidine kinase
VGRQLGTLIDIVAIVHELVTNSASHGISDQIIKRVEDSR